MYILILTSNKGSIHLQFCFMVLYYLCAL